MKVCGCAHGGGGTRRRGCARGCARGARKRSFAETLAVKRANRFLAGVVCRGFREFWRVFGSFGGFWRAGRSRITGGISGSCAHGEIRDFGFAFGCASVPGTGGAKECDTGAIQGYQGDASRWQVTRSPYQRIARLHDGSNLGRCFRDGVCRYNCRIWTNFRSS